MLFLQSYSLSILTAGFVTSSPLDLEKAGSRKSFTLEEVAVKRRTPWNHALEKERIYLRRGKTVPPDVAIAVKYALLEQEERKKSTVYNMTADEDATIRNTTLWS